jgi:hypothetical protein
VRRCRARNVYLDSTQAPSSRQQRKLWYVGSPDHRRNAAASRRECGGKCLFRRGGRLLALRSAEVGATPATRRCGIVFAAARAVSFKDTALERLGFGRVFLVNSWAQWREVMRQLAPPVAGL